LSQSTMLRSYPSGLRMVPNLSGYRDIVGHVLKKLLSKRGQAKIVGPPENVKVTRRMSSSLRGTGDAVRNWQ